MGIDELICKKGSLHTQKVNRVCVCVYTHVVVKELTLLGLTLHQ